MFMRFRGGGVGHKTTRHASDMFLNDRHPLDLKRQQAEDPDSSEDEDMEIELPCEAPAGNEDQIAEEDDAYGYTDLNTQGTDEEEEEDQQDEEGEDECGDDDALGPEDGEGVDDETEALGFSTL